MWKRVLAAAVLVLTVGPALAADGNTVASAAVPGGAVVSGAQGAAAIPSRDVAASSQAALRDLSNRVSSLEQKVDRMTPPPPTPEELKRASIERENEAYVLRHAWTDGG